MKFYTTSRISENIFETPEGFLLCLGVAIARTGEMEYGPGETPIKPGPDGKVLVSREADEVFRPETLASFSGKPVTIAHPSVFVSPDNWSELSKGIVQNVRRGTGAQSDDIVADVLITDGKAIALVKGGLREVSCGYEAEYVETGVGRGVQKNIIGNHLALVDEGRAGSSYAINDHKGKAITMKLGDKIKAIFAKAQDEALAVAKDEGAAAEPTATNQSYDELVKMVKDLGEKIGGMAKPAAKDDTKPATENSPAETVAKDEEVASPLEARLAKLEAMVSKLMEGKAKEDAPTGDEEEKEMSEDDDDMMTDKACEDDDEESAIVGDSASRIEILAPGMVASGKDFKVNALKAAYATKDGKAVIEQFTLGSAPDLKNAQLVDSLFIAASEVLKVQRSKDLSGARARTRDEFLSNMGTPVGARTAEDINQFNAKFYGSK